jgi:hypothetical protein
MEMKRQVTETRLREIAASWVVFSVARLLSEPIRDRAAPISAAYKISFSLPTSLPHRPRPKFCQRQHS